MADQKSDSTVVKIVGLVAAAGAAWVAGRVIDKLWTAFFGHSAPKADDGEMRFAEIAGAAIVSGALVALFRAAATQGEFHVLSLATFLPGQVERGVVVVGVDIERVSRPQLDDVLAGLGGIGAEVLGVVGIT